MLRSKAELLQAMKLASAGEEKYQYLIDFVDRFAHLVTWQDMEIKYLLPPSLIDELDPKTLILHLESPGSVKLITAGVVGYRQLRPEGNSSVLSVSEAGCHPFFLGLHALAYARFHLRFVEARARAEACRCFCLSCWPERAAADVDLLLFVVEIFEREIANLRSILKFDRFASRFGHRRFDQAFYAIYNELEYRFGEARSEAEDSMRDTIIRRVMYAKIHSPEKLEAIAQEQLDRERAALSSLHEIILDEEADEPFSVQ